MLRRVISGGQTGVDQAALSAARALGIETGGTAPRLFMAEAGPAPWLADFGLVESPEPTWGPPFGGPHTPEYRKWLASIWPPRTQANVRDADGTIWLGGHPSRGFACTHDAALAVRTDYPFLIVYPGLTTPSKVAGWIEAKGIRTLNVAGHRESSHPGIGDRAERFLRAVFRRAIG